jgi:diadenosine tetraphosphate (Ap4A) HIT family hydrolase
MEKLENISGIKENNGQLITMAENGGHHVLLKATFIPSIEDLDQEWIESASNSEFSMYHTDDRKKFLEICWAPTEDRIEKYRSQDKIEIIETPELYQKIKKKFIDKLKPIKWVNEIIEGIREKEAIIHSSDSIVVAIDPKWKSEKVEDLHILVFSREWIKTIRDLRYEHLDLLKEMVHTKTIVAKKYGLELNKIRAYFHYHPSVYHLHLHLTHVNSHDGYGRYFSLESIISSIERDPDYFLTATFNYIIPRRLRPAKIVTNSI